MTTEVVARFVMLTVELPLPPVAFRQLLAVHEVLLPLFPTVMVVFAIPAAVAVTRPFAFTVTLAMGAVVPGEELTVANVVAFDPLVVTSPESSEALGVPDAIRRMPVALAREVPFNPVAAVVLVAVAAKATLFSVLPVGKFKA
jgi:hypothetical protein